MRSFSIDLPARRTAWLADHAYQIRLTEQARSLAAAAEHVQPTRLRLAAASMPETHENGQLAEWDEVWVRFTFEATELTVGHETHRRRPHRSA